MSIIVQDGIIKAPDFDYVTDRSLGNHIFECLNRYKYRGTFMRFSETDAEIAYDTFQKYCIRTSLKLLDGGITEDDVICICSDNTNQYFAIPFVSSAYIGAKVSSIHPILSLNEVTHLLGLITPTIIFLIQDSIDLIEKATNQIVIKPKLVVLDGKSSNDESIECFDEFLKFHNDENSFVPVDVALEATALIVFSSGTTNLPKGLCLNSMAILSQVQNFAKTGWMGNIGLTYTTLFWISGIWSLVGAISSGTILVIGHEFSAEKFWATLGKYKISCSSITASMASEICKYGTPKNAEASFYLQGLNVGGSLVVERNLIQLRKLFPRTFIAHCYGQTETGLITIFNPCYLKHLRYHSEKIKSCGPPCSGFTLKVVDTESEGILGPNQHGELRVKSKFLMNGYYKQDSSSTFDSEGWLKTGDIVYYDEDFCFYCVDRIKSMLKYKGFQIPPSIVENLIDSHPKVQQSIVLGLPDENGDLLTALVVLEERSEANDKLKMEIRQFVSDRVPDYMKLRGGVEFIREIPVAPSGKIKREELRNMVVNGKIL